MHGPRPSISLPMPCRVEAVGAPARAVAATAVSRRVDEDFATGGGLAGSNPLRPDGRDEIDQLAYCDRSEAFVEPASWPGGRREGPAAAGTRDDFRTADDLGDDRVQAGDEVGCARRGQDVEKPAAEGPAVLEVMAMDGRVDAVLVEKAA